jgi:hypothetical protein
MFVVPNEIIDQFEVAKEQLITTHAKWNLLEQLYAKSKLRSEFLRRIGSDFFALVQDSVLTDIMMSFGRLLETPHAKGNNNLTLERLQNSVYALGNEELALKLDVHLRDARAAYEATRKYRNKRIAHNDLKTILENDAISLGPHTVRDIKKALKEVSEFLNQINMHYRNCTIAFGLVSMQGDADYIVGLTRDGLKLRETKYNMERHQAGLDPVDWSIPDDV